MLLSGDGVVRATNPDADRLLGDALVGTRLRDLVVDVDEDVQKLLRTWAMSPVPSTGNLTFRRDAAASLDGEPTMATTVLGSRIETSNDDSYHISVRVTPWQSDSGDQAVRVSEQRFRLAFDSVLLGMALEKVDEHRFGELAQVNEALCRILGRDAEQFRLLTLLDVTHPDDVDESVAALASLARGHLDSWQA
ncbi:MAG: hypothetical protein QOC92_259, partial [Acidimicrobiaceae bacterium]